MAGWMKKKTGSFTGVTQRELAVKSVDVIHSNAGGV